MQEERSEEIGQRILHPLHLKDPAGRYATERADDRVAQAGQHARVRVDRPRARPKPSSEAVVHGAVALLGGDVQPGVGNPTPADATLTLAEMSERTLGVLRRRRDIACVLVNPLQALHPNAAAPSDATLVDGSRRAGFDRAAYADWLRQLRKVCDERGIALIFDEVFVGFRLARGGAQDYFGVRADLVTYGKSLGGGLPVGVLCGRAALMRRYRDDRPADVCFARGTFNSHPQVMGAMNVFLRRLDDPNIKALYDGLDQRWDDRAAQLNATLEARRKRSGPSTARCPRPARGTAHRPVLAPSRSAQTC